MSLLRDVASIISPEASSSGLTGERGWLSDWAGGGVTSAGEPVNETTALSFSAYFAAIRAISEDLAKLPLPLMRRLARGREPVPGHVIDDVFNLEFNPYLNAMAGREVLIAWALASGGGLAHIRQNARGDTELWPIHPDRWQQVWRSGALFYKVLVDPTAGDDRFREMMLPASEVFHVYGVGPDGYRGHSILRHGAESLGIALAGQRFAGAYLGNGLSAGTVLVHPEQIGPDALKNLSESLAKFRAARNAGKTLVLEENIKLDRLGVDPQEAQLIETRQFEVVEVARWFRMPPHKLQDLLRGTFSNIEHQSIEYVVDTLTPWAKRIQLEARRKLLREDRALYIRHNFDALLQGDVKTRMAFYRTMFHVGAMSPNDIREKEDHNPIDDEAADDYYVQGAITPLGSVGSNSVSGTGPEGTDESAKPEAPESPEDDERQDQAESIVGARTITHASSPVLREAIARSLRRETNAVKGPASRLADDPKSFTEWVNEFYSKQRAYMTEALEPWRALVETLAGGRVDLGPAIDRVLDPWQSDAIQSTAAAFHARELPSAIEAAETHRTAALVDDLMHAALDEIEGESTDE